MGFVFVYVVSVYAYVYFSSGAQFVLIFQIKHSSSSKLNKAASTTPTIEHTQNPYSLFCVRVCVCVQRAHPTISTVTVTYDGGKKYLFVCEMFYHSLYTYHYYSLYTTAADMANH